MKNPLEWELVIIFWEKNSLQCGAVVLIPCFGDKLYYRITEWEKLEGTTMGWRSPSCCPWQPWPALIPDGSWPFSSHLYLLWQPLYIHPMSWHWFHFLCIYCLHSSNDRSSLIVHRPLSPWPDSFLTWMQHSQDSRKWSLNINQLSWTSFSCRPHSHGILPRSFLKRLKLALAEFMITILLPCFLLPPSDLYGLMVTTAKAVPIIHISKKVFFVY